MQQYIYGNIGHRQYTYLSTAPDFFSDSRRVEELRHLVTYDIYGKHGDLQPGEHQCYWGLTTDLNIPGEPERLYLQCSGADTYRSAFYAQGFMSDSKDGFLYGKGFLQLLRVHFPAGEDTLKRADSGSLAEAFPQPERDASLSPAELDPELLRSILLLLLQGRRVLLRIDASGKEAMHRSREILLAVYSRLPYGQRRLNGFLTGCTPAQLQNEENTLPGAVSLILADADTPASELYLDGAQLLDMNEPVKPVPRSFQGKPLPHTALLDYLMQSDMETLDSFFKTASQNIEQDRSPTVADYSLMLELFKQVSRPITDEVLAEWAIQLQSGSLQGDLRQMLLDNVCQRVTEEQMEEYLMHSPAVQSFSQLAQLGNIPQEQRTAALSQFRKSGEVQDPNAGFSMLMFDRVFQARGEAGAEEQLRLVRAGGYHFFKLLLTDCPEQQSLRSGQYTKKAIRGIEKMELPQALGQTTADRIRQDVAQRREKCVQEMRARHAEELTRQRNAGLKAIDHALRLFIENGYWEGLCKKLEELFAQLRENYLAEELLHEEGDDSWPVVIRDSVVVIFTRAIISTQSQCLAAEEAVQQVSELLGQLDCPLSEQDLEDLDAWLKNCRTYAELFTPCRTLRDFVHRIQQLDVLELPKELARNVYASSLSVICERTFVPQELFAEKESLRFLSKRPDGGNFVQKILRHCPDLGTIPEEAPQKAREYVCQVDSLMEAVGLDSHSIYLHFRPLIEKYTVYEISTFMDWAERFPQEEHCPIPLSDNALLWLARWYTHNLKLMAFAAKRLSEKNQAEFVRLLAANVSAQKQVVQEFIRALYMNGFSDKVLLQGAGENTRETWKAAAKECLAPVEPLEFQWNQTPETKLPAYVWWKKKSQLLAAVSAGMLLLAGLIIPLVLLLFGNGSVILTAAALGVTLLGAAAAFVIGLRADEKIRRWVLAQGLALVPGLLFDIVVLILSLL